MMWMVVLNFYMIIIIFLTLYVNKKTFCSCNFFKGYISYIFYRRNTQNDEIQDSFVMTSLWADHLKSKSSWQSRKPSYFMLLLLFSNDLETLPGPNIKKQLDRILWHRAILHQNTWGLLSSFTNICKLIDTHRHRHLNITRDSYL